MAAPSPCPSGGCSPTCKFLNARYQPFEGNAEDDLQSASLSSTLITLVCGVLMKSGEGGAVVSLVVMASNVLTVLLVVYLICFFTVPGYMKIVKKNARDAMAEAEKLSQVSSTLELTRSHLDLALVALCSR